MDQKMLAVILVLIHGWLIAHVIKKSFNTFLMFKMDKYLAVNHQNYRISEACLISSMVKGGCFGAIAGMLICRHKTLKPAFWFVAFTVSCLWVFIIGIVMPVIYTII